MIGFCVPAGEDIGPGDRFINEWIDRAPQARKVAIVTKCETVPKPRVAEQLLALQALRDWDALVPVSSVEAINLEPLVDELLGLLPESEPLYPQDMITEERYIQRVSELIREAALEGVHDELPHSIAVVVDDIIESEEGQDIYADLIVERDSQKGIIIGKGASRLKNVRRFAQRRIAAMSDQPVTLHLHVRVAKDWQRDPKQLGRLGF